jgi:hypothetical protein
MTQIFDYKSHARKIINVAAKDLDLAHHLWLEGFSIIDNDFKFDSSSVDAYVEDLLKKYKKFTPLVSKSFSNDFSPMISEGSMRPIHLPITDEYHLEFWLEAESSKEKLFYMACSDDCRVLAPYVFPLFNLKASLDFSNDPHIQPLIDYGMFFYDPTMMIGYQSIDMIIRTYDSMSKFVKHSGKN